VIAAMWSGAVKVRKRVMVFEISSIQQQRRPSPADDHTASDPSDPPGVLPEPDGPDLPDPFPERDPAEPEPDLH